MALDDARIGPAGEVLAANIHRVRTAQRLGFAELSRLLSDVGRPIPELGLRRIEKGERRVDFDDLLALAYVLKICPVDLMVSKDATDEAYPVTPDYEFEADSVRDWIRGEDIHLRSITDPDAFFAEPGTIMFDALSWMPTDRRKHATRRWLDHEDEDQS